jgi:release factor glutamine methyltransferase
MTLKDALIRAQKQFRDKGIASAPLDAEVLLLEAASSGGKEMRDKRWLYMNLAAYELSLEENILFESFVTRRIAHEPVAYITGRKEFYGLDFAVDNRVLIPRAETEIIVDETLDILLSAPHKVYTLLDIGTGSGCIALSVLHTAKERRSDNLSEVLACDISADAINAARKNAKRHGLSSDVRFMTCDLVEAIHMLKNTTDSNVIITANLPYISTEDYKKLQPNVRIFEPKLALTTEDNGLYHINRLLDIFAEFSHYFASYHLILEADPKQMRAITARTRKMLTGACLHIIKDLRKKKRVIRIDKNI